MPNLSGTLNVFRAVFKPGLIVPHLTVKTIRSLNFPALKRAGYQGAVFDKDNCLTLPRRDYLVPELEKAWRECKETFGAENVLIVSNSAGTKNDVGLIQAESVSHHLGVPVLVHTTKKPGCLSAVKRYFTSSPSETTTQKKIIVIGDRLFTDVLMANRFEKGTALAVWTTHLWERDSTILRWIESQFLKNVLAYRRRKNRPSSDEAYSGFLRPEPSLGKPRQMHRGWFVQYSILALRFTGGASLAILAALGRTSRRLYTRLTEGQEGRVTRLKRIQDVDEALKADRRSRRADDEPDHATSTFRAL